MKQLFSQSVIQSFPSYGLACLAVFFFSCRSLPPEQRLRANVRTEESTAVDRSELVWTTWNELLRETFALKVDESSAVETVITRYDTSLPVDSITGLHPIKEIVQSSATKRKESALSDGIEQEKTRERHRVTDTAPVISMKTNGMSCFWGAGKIMVTCSSPVAYHIKRIEAFSA